MLSLENQLFYRCAPSAARYIREINIHVYQCQRAFFARKSFPVVACQLLVDGFQSRTVMVYIPEDLEFIVRLS